MELTNNNNNYGGTTYINGGTLQLGDGVSNNGSVTSTTIANSGVLTFANPYAQTYGGSITGSGGLLKAGPGTLSLTSNFPSFNGPTTVNAGNLAFVNQLYGNTIITINSPGALNVTNAYPTVNDWLTSTNNNDINFINPASTGAVALTGNDSESIYLPGTGYNTLSVGAVAGGATFSGTLTPAASTYYLGGGGGPLTYTPAITGNYGLAVGSLGSVILTGSNSYTGLTTIASGGTLQFSGAANRTVGSNISGGGALVMAGPGTVTLLTGTNTYTGGTSVNAGTLEAATTASLPGYNSSGVTVAGGTLPNSNAPYFVVSGGGVLAVQTSGGATAGWNSTQIGSLLANATWGNETAALGIDTTNGDFTYGGVINQAVSLAKLGPNNLTLTAANSYTGNTAVSGGTLTFTNTNTFGGVNGGGIPWGL